MGIFVALLRAVNVGGAGKLSMADLRKLCAAAGFADVETFIASGNVVFSYAGSAEAAQDALARRLGDHVGRPVGVLARRAQDLAAIVERNPFRIQEPSKTFVIFLGSAPPPDALGSLSGRTNELLSLGEREIYAYYPDGAGRSKLKIPAAKAGTARNLNTTRALLKLAAARNA